jgi:hypothetical protein
MPAPSRGRFRPRVKGTEADVKCHPLPIGVSMFCGIAMGISLPWSAQPDRKEMVTLRATLGGAAASPSRFQQRCVERPRQSAWQWWLSDGKAALSSG